MCVCVGDGAVRDEMKMERMRENIDYEEFFLFLFSSLFPNVAAF